MNKNTIIMLSAVLVITTGLIFLSNRIRQTGSPTGKSSSASSSELKTFRSSDLMDFSVGVPNEYEVTEEFGSVMIAGDRGKLYVDLSGTNFDTLGEYLVDLSVKNKFSLDNKQDMVINGLNAAKVVREDRITYYIYVDGIVYSLFTESPELYSVLDQIAQSFRYTPD